MRVLLFGGAGMLGRDIRAGAPAGAEIVAPSSGDVDIGDARAVAAAIARWRPAVVINAAAYTRVDDAEAARDDAFRVNADGPAHIGLACARHGVRVVHFSTDYVFSGRGERPCREDDATGPVNVYGASKLAGERALLGSGASALVVRTAWLFGVHGRSFPRTMHQRAVARQATRVVNDQRGRPTFTVDLAAATWTLLDAGTTGIVHATNAGPPTTWYGIAQRIFERAGAGHLLSSCASAEYPVPAPRPSQSILDTTRLGQLLGRELPEWPEALDRFLALLARQPSG